MTQDEDGGRRRALPGRTTAGEARGAPRVPVGKRTLSEALPPGPAGADASPLALPPGVDYRHTGAGLSLVVRRRWLEADPAWRPGARSGLAPARARELLAHLRALGVIGWAAPEAIERAARDTQITTSGRGEVVRLHWTAALYGHLGLPPGAPAAVTLVGDGAVVAVSAPDLAGEPGARVALGAAQLRALLRALEGATGMVAPADTEGALEAAGAAGRVAAQGGRGAFTMRVDRATLEALFGRAQVAAWSAARESARARPGAAAAAATTTTVGAGRVREHGLTPEQAARVRAWLARHLGGAAAGDAFLDRQALAAIERVEAHPHREQVLAALAQLRAGGGAAAGAAVTAWELDALLQEALIAGEQAALGIARPAPAPLRPSFGTPLPARIRQHAGRVVSGERVPLSIEVAFPPALLDAQRDHDFRYRAFSTDVVWLFEKLGGGGRPERVHRRYRGAEDRVEHRFVLAPGEERAIWSVRAHVRHTHFLPAYLTTLVEVKAEPVRMAELRDEALRDLGPVRGRAHDFRTSPYNEALGDERYDQGQRFEGELPAGFRARTPAERARQRAAERARLEQLVAFLGERPGHGDAMRAARRHLERLREADGAITTDEVLGARSFEVRGTFLSRQPGIEDGPLDLYGSARRSVRRRTNRASAADRQVLEDEVVRVQLRDLSRRFESEAYVFEGEGADFDAALEAAFVTLCKAYPPGRVALVAQRLDARGAAPTGKTLGFELDTGTAWKDHKAKLFDPVVETIVTVGSIAAMVFVPASAPLVSVLVTTYGAIEAFDELAGAAAKGTLSGARLAMNLGSIALDLFPLVGRATPLGRTRAGWLVVEGLDHGGQAAFMTAAAYGAIRSLQEQQLLGIARQFEALLALERSTHPSDPRLAAMRAKIEADAARVRGAVYEALDGLIRDQALAFGTSKAALAAHGAMLTREMQRLADLGAFVHVAGALPHYDRARGVAVADPRQLDAPTLQRLEAARAAHLREVGERVAAELGVAPEHVAVVLGAETGLAMAAGRVTLTYQPGTPLDGALARWRMQATSARRAAYRGAPAAAAEGAAAGSGGLARRADDDPVFETRAEMVPGSTFRGRGGRARGPEVLREARDALLAVFRASGGATIEPVDAARYDKAAPRAIAEQTFVITLPGAPGAPPERFTIRLATGPLPGETVARTVVNPTQQGFSPTAASGGGDGHRIRGRYVIQLSEELDPAHVLRAVAHEVAEIRALRELSAADRYAGPDALRPGAAVGVLSPHDRGRLAEIEVLAEQLADPGAAPAVREQARQELAALVEHLGLRAGGPGAGARRELAAAHLGPRARAALDEARRTPAPGTREHTELAALRERARADEAAEEKRRAARRPAHAVPSATDEHGRPLSGEALRERGRRAAEARQRRSDETWAQLEELHRAAGAAGAAGAGGAPPLLPFELQIGGGASLAARDRTHLLIDDRGRWQADGNDEIAQTATQLRPARDAGLGDPTVLVGPNERVPRDAVALWEDDIAAQGPVVNGRATLRLGERGALLVDILCNGKTLTFRTDKVPYVATGFVPERLPGMPMQARPVGVAAAVGELLAGAAAKPALGPAAQAAAARAHAALLATPMVTHRDAAKLEAILGAPELRAAFGDAPAFQEALALGAAAANWRDLVAKDDPSHPHIFFGDDANLGRAQALRSHNWVIAGSGGTAVSAAEIVLRENGRARVTLIGDDSPAGLLENDQLVQLGIRHADAALATKLGEPPGDGRLRIINDKVKAPIGRDGTRPPAGTAGAEHWVDESDIPAHLRSRRTYDVNGDEAHPHGTAYVAAIGRAADYPPVVAALIDQVRREGGNYEVKALLHDRQYVGYTVKFFSRDEQPVGQVDVTGAASRFLPVKDAVAHAPLDEEKEALSKVPLAEDWDAPGESGNFAGGFAATATQAAAYSDYRKFERR